ETANVKMTNNNPSMAVKFFVILNQNLFHLSILEYSRFVDFNKILYNKMKLNRFPVNPMRSNTTPSHPKDGCISRFKSALAKMTTTGIEKTIHTIKIIIDSRIVSETYGLKIFNMDTTKMRICVNII